MKKSKNKATRRALTLAAIVILSVAIAGIYGKYINKAVEKTTEISEYSKFLSYFSGTKKPIKILVLFQNNAEARYGGGFIGTVGVIEINQGRLKPYTIRGVYYYDNLANDPNYYKEEVTTVNGRKILQSYTLRDSGQDVGWPSNAQRAKRIFEKESGISIDAVLGVSPEVLKCLLDFVGPVYLKDYDKTVSSSNILESVQLEVESGEDKANHKDPKSILTSLANSIINKLSEKNISQLIELKNPIIDLVKQRHFVAYSSENDIQNILKKYKVSGDIVSYSGDYMQMSEKSISGTKTGPFIKRSVRRSVSIEENGKTSVDLEMTRKHSATERLFRYFDPNWKGYNYLVGHDEVEIKFLLPRATKILSSSVDLNFIGQESNYNVYSYRVLTDVNSESRVKIKYESPYINFNSRNLQYGSYLQLPVGSFPVFLNDCITVPVKYKKTYSNHDYEQNTEGGALCYDATIREDFTANFSYAK